MPPILLQLAAGLILSALIGYVGYRRGSLSRSGVVGAMIVGTTIFGFGGWGPGLMLITFFVTSSLLSHYKESVKEKLAEKFDKGHQRDLGQALANGGAGALFALGMAIWPGGRLWLPFLGALATVNADTWATELGVLNKGKPRLITSGRPVEVGTSGGVSLVGILAALAGALLIALVAALEPYIRCEIALIGVSQYPNVCALETGFWHVPVTGAVAGLAGALFDSLLGATVQAIYWCPSCQKETERKVHTCGTVTERRRGWAWLNNDWVNFISSVFGAVVAVLVYSVLVPPFK